MAWKSTKDRRQQDSHYRKGRRTAKLSPAAASTVSRPLSASSRLRQAALSARTIQCCWRRSARPLDDLALLSGSAWLVEALPARRKEGRAEQQASSLTRCSGHLPSPPGTLRDQRHQEVLDFSGAKPSPPRRGHYAFIDLEVRRLRPTTQSSGGRSQGCRAPGRGWHLAVAQALPGRRHPRSSTSTNMPDGLGCDL